MRYFACVTPLVGAFVDDYGDDNDDCNGFDGVTNGSASSPLLPTTLCYLPICALLTRASDWTRVRNVSLFAVAPRRSCPRFDCCASYFPCVNASSGRSFVDFLIISPWSESFRCFTVM